MSPAVVYRGFLLGAHSALFALVSFTVLHVHAASPAMDRAASLTLGAYALGAVLASVSLVRRQERLARYCAVGSGILLLLLTVPAALDMLRIIGQSD